MSEPTFTSSTYRDRAPLNLDPDRPLSEQSEVQEFLNDKSSPVPEIVLYRLLSLAEVYLRETIPIPAENLMTLYIGYEIVVEGTVKLYYVGWSRSPASLTFEELYEGKSQDDNFDQTMIQSLTNLIKDELEQRTQESEIAKLIEVFVTAQLIPPQSDTLSFVESFNTSVLKASLCGSGYHTHKNHPKPKKCYRDETIQGGGNHSECKR